SFAFIFSDEQVKISLRMKDIPEAGKVGFRKRRQMITFRGGPNDTTSRLQITFGSFTNNDACLLTQSDITARRFSHRFEYLISVLGEIEQQGRNSQGMALCELESP